MVLSSPARWHSKVLHDTSPKRTQHFNIEVSSRFEIRSNIKFWLPVHMMRCRTVTVKWRYPVSISMGGSSRSVFFWGGNCSGPQPNLTPNSSFSSEFGHFILKIRQNIFFIFENFPWGGGANRRYFQNLWGSWPPRGSTYEHKRHTKYGSRPMSGHKGSPKWKKKSDMQHIICNTFTLRI